MVIPHGLGKFYGSSLPRPRIYTDVKFNHERVDPPLSVVDPLLSWAHEAHWSMGGLSTKRLRLQGRIEGNISKLRAENEKIARKTIRNEQIPEPEAQIAAESPPPAPVPASRKRRFMALVEDEEEVEEVRVAERRKPARKLINEFNSVAENRRSPRSNAVKSRGGSFVRKMMKAAESLSVLRNGGEESAPVVESESSGEEDRSVATVEKSPRVRASPRLMKKKL